MRPCLVHPRESECNVTTTVGRHENGTPEYQHLAAMVCEAVNDGSGVSGFPGHSEESWRRICLPLSRRQSRRHCARCSSISWRHACSARGHGLPVRTNARSCWLDLCQRGGGLFSTYQAWSQLSYATIRLDPFGIPPSACPLVDTVTRRSRARARLPGPAVGGEGKGGCMFRTLCLSKLTRPASRCRFKSLHSTACESGCSTG